MIDKQFKTPRLEIYPSRITDNAKNIIKLCSDNGVKVALVTKVACAHQAVANALLEAQPEMFADSRIQNLWKLKEMGITLPLMLLRLPALSEASEVVRIADISLNSSLDVLKALSNAALSQNKIHKVVLMVDVGDLREGVLPEKLLMLARESHKLKGLELLGIGCNLACFGGVIPTKDNMNLMVKLHKDCCETLKESLPIICAGNSSGLPILMQGNLPKEINLYRLGESVVLGRNVIDRSPLPNTRQDTFVAVAEIIEIEEKQSAPIGEKGQDAFGNTPEFEDIGMRIRAICNIGRQDVDIEGLTPLDSKINVLGGSSDHLIIDVTDSDTSFKVGDEIAFYPGYGALLALSTSPYVQKVVIRK